MAISGCAPNKRYADFDAAPPHVQWLARASRAGDASAQFELGRRLMTGEEVAPDCRAGLALIRAAAKTKTRSRVTIIPRARPGQISTVQVVDGGPVRVGYGPARQFLAEPGAQCPAGHRR